MPSNMAQIQIVYGSNGGNTQLVCQFIEQELTALGHQVDLQRCELFDIKTITQNDLLILACPTYEHGSLEPNFKKIFWPKIQELDFNNHPCAVVGLGDIKYDLDYHIESARILEQYFKTHNAQLAHYSLMISGRPLPLLEKLVKPWCNRLHSKIEAL